MTNFAPARKSKTPRKGKRSKPSGLKAQSHFEVGPEFWEIGSKMRGRPVRKMRSALLVTEGDYKPGAASLLARMEVQAMPSAKFGQSWRRIQRRQDELVSTASIHKLMSGAVADGALPPAKQAEMEHTFELMSRLRFPTRWTGFATKEDGIMQHPTKVGTGIYGDSRTTMSLHNELDLRRRVEVAAAMSAAYKAKDATAESIATAGMRRAIEFSLNEFIAPATAENVKIMPGVSAKERNEQMLAREGLKAILIGLGGSQDAGPESSSRRFSIRPGKRSASPPRASLKKIMGTSGPKLGPAQ